MVFQITLLHRASNCFIPYWCNHLLTFAPTAKPVRGSGAIAAPIAPPDTASASLPESKPLEPSLADVPEFGNGFKTPPALAKLESSDFPNK